MNETSDTDNLQDVINPKQRVRPLNHRQKEFARIRATEPKLTNAAVATKAGYNTTSLHSASQMATKLLKKDEIQLEMSKWSSDAENTVYEVMKLAKTRMQDDGIKDVSRIGWANAATETANSILDRVHGKSKQTVDITSKSVNINIDLSMDSTELLTPDSVN